MQRLTALAWLLLAAGCTIENPPAAPAELDRAFFDCEVTPVLVARCAFYACHGTAARPFHLFGPNRLRLGVTERERAITLTGEERERNYAMGLSFAEPAAGYDEPLLVEKPLAESLGGAHHEGAELYGGGDVFLEEDDPELALLRDWVAGESLPEGCEP